MPRLSYAAKVALAGAALFVTACASTPPTDVACVNSQIFRLPIDTAPIPPSMREVMSTADPGAVGEAIAGAMIGAAGETHPYSRSHIAVLSGGGEFGAYGAGLFETFMKNTGAGIRFDVVTGVSTGALQATGVFLGGEDDLAELVAGFNIEREDDFAVKRPSIGRLPLENSLYTLAPARAQFRRFLTDDRLDRIAAAAREGRKLLVGVVEVQDGQFYAFDLTAIAASGRAREDIRQCYTEAVFASAAVPVVFPPVLLDGRQYFDGGVRASLFLDVTTRALMSMPADYAEMTSVYVLFNGYLETPAQDELAASLIKALTRTREITFDQIDRTSLQTVAQLADRFDVKWTRIEPGLCQEARERAPKEEIFNAPFMQCLIAEGRLHGARPEPFMPIR